MGIDKIIQVQSGVFLVCFQSKQQQEDVLHSHIPPFDHKQVIASPWTSDIPLHKAEIQGVPVWVQLPDLPLKYWKPEVLGRLTSQLGIPMMPDILTTQRDRGQYARVLVHVEIKAQAKEKVFYKDEKMRLVHQTVRYE